MNSAGEECVLGFLQEWVPISYLAVLINEDLRAEGAKAVSKLASHELGLEAETLAIEGHVVAQSLYGVVVERDAQVHVDLELFLHEGCNEGVSALNVGKECFSSLADADLLLGVLVGHVASSFNACDAATDD